MQLRHTFLFLLLSTIFLSTKAQNTFPASGAVGIGTTTPHQRLHIEGSANQAIFVNTSVPSNISGSGIIGYMKALPSASGHRLGYFLFGSRGGAQNNYNVAGMVGYAGDAWTSTSRPAYLAFETTAPDFTVRRERMRIDPIGNVGIGTTAPNASAILDLTSTTRGMLTPRMTLAQRNAIASPACGLLIFQTDNTSGFYYYDSAWKAVTPSTSGYANTALSNLSATAINVDLVPGTHTAYNLGMAGKGWKDLYLTEGVYLNGELFLHKRGSNNTFVGSSAGYDFYGSGSENTGVGYEVLYSLTTGFRNTANGYKTLFSNTTGSHNTASGVLALYNNTTGAVNTANGHLALFNNTEGWYNTAQGNAALFSNTTGRENTAISHQALYLNTTGSNNTANGLGALSFNTEGNFNTASGYGSLNNNTVGSYNTALGNFADVSTENLSNATAIGYFAKVDASNKVRIGNTAVTSIGGQVGWTVFSDGRYKRNIHEDVQGLSFINQLRPVTYTVDVAELNTFYNKGGKQPEDENRKAADEKYQAAFRQSAEKASKIVYNGFIAQEVEKAAKKLKYEFSGVDKPQTEGGLYGLRYADFVVPLVKAVQELSKENEELKRKVEKVEELEKQIAEIKDLLVRNNTNGTTVNISSAYLEQNTPNPSKGATTIRYHVQENAGAAHLTLTNSKGQLLKTINITSRGTGQLNLETSALPAGIYNYSLWIAGRKVDTKQLVITR